jgi:hypothetical protein
MKMKTRLILMSLLMGWLTATAPAADTVAPDKIVEVARPPKFDLNFPGGPPAKLVDAIEQASGARINVLVSPRLAGLILPRIELRSVDAETVFRSLPLLGIEDSTAVRWAIGKENNVWVFQTPPEYRQTKVFYLGDLLEKFKIDDITTAIQTTWQLGGKESGAEMKFHRETQLLIARGDESRLQTINGVLNELRRALPETARSDEGKKPSTSSGLAPRR